MENNAQAPLYNVIPGGATTLEELLKEYLTNGSAHVWFWRVIDARTAEKALRDFIITLNKVNPELFHDLYAANITVQYKEEGNCIKPGRLTLGEA